MRKRKLIREVEEIIKDEEEDALEINQTTKDFIGMLFSKCFSDIILFVILLLISLSLYDYVSKLSFVSPNIYVTALIIIIGYIFISAVTIFFLYIYKVRKNIEYQKHNLKKSYRFYQFNDAIMFITKVVSIIYAIMMFIITPAEVTGTSMADTYAPNDRVLVWHLFKDIKKGDVVIIDVSDNRYNLYGDTDFIIKRVVAVGGDKLSYEGKKLSVNGKLIQENVSIEQFENMLTDKRYDNNEEYFNDSYVVPKGFYIVLGDNRNNSQDSRNIGLINEKDILGECIFRIYPFSKIGIPKQNHKS